MSSPNERQLSITLYTRRVLNIIRQHVHIVGEPVLLGTCLTGWLQMASLRSRLLSKTLLLSLVYAIYCLLCDRVFWNKYLNSLGKLSDICYICLMNFPRWLEEQSLDFLKSKSLCNIVLNQIIVIEEYYLLFWSVLP